MNSIVIAKNLVKKFKQFTAVDGISFEVQEGECLGFLGPNGAGKTTTVRMIHCVSPRTGGELIVAGREANVDDRAIKKMIGVVQQEINLDKDLSVYQNLRAFAGFYDIHGKEAEQRVNELLAFIDLTAKRNSRIEELSTGMKRRVQIARALINQPKIIVADEPTTGLDPLARLMIWQKLKELKQNGVTMILTTQHMEEAEALCDRVLIMHKGKIIDVDTTENLKRKHGQPNLEGVFLKLTGAELEGGTKDDEP